MLSVDDKVIIEVIADVNSGLKKYKKIMELFNNHKIDVSKDKDFQRYFNDFFQMGRHNEEFYNEYYSYFEFLKGSVPDFKDAMDAFYKKIGKVEASFISKMLHMLDNNLPIYDNNILKYFWIVKPTHSDDYKKRIQKAIVIYRRISQWYADFIPGEEGQKWLRLFDEQYPDSNISSVKKIDFILGKLGAVK
ncbi:MAG: hypothetical protein FWD22_04880 [Treponema sp.]|nr:hypothetical protein [Treponema sp.]